MCDGLQVRAAYVPLGVDVSVGLLGGESAHVCVYMCECIERY